MYAKNLLTVLYFGLSALVIRLRSSESTNITPLETSRLWNVAIVPGRYSSADREGGQVAGSDVARCGRFAMQGCRSHLGSRCVGRT